MKMEIKITFNLQLLTFLNLIPDDNDPEELYTMEIKVGNKLSKKTELVKYEDFQNQIWSDVVQVSEIVDNKVVFGGFYQFKSGVNKFLGDFELDLSPYYRINGDHDM